MERVIRLKSDRRFYYDSCRFVFARKGTRFTIEPARNLDSRPFPATGKFWGTPVNPRHPANAVAGTIGCLLYEGEDF